MSLIVWSPADERAIAPLTKEPSRSWIMCLPNKISRRAFTGRSRLLLLAADEIDDATILMARIGRRAIRGLFGGLDGRSRIRRLVIRAGLRTLLLAALAT